MNGTSGIPEGNDGEAVMAVRQHLIDHGVTIPTGVIRTALAVAAPLIISQRESATARSIAAAERERIARLAEAEAVKHCNLAVEDALTDFADLIRGNRP